LLGVPRAMLPEVCPSSQVYGDTEESLFGGKIPIAGDAGDQQAATLAKHALSREREDTYGTGCFMLLNIGDSPRLSEHKLLTTVGWQVGGKTTYCLEGAVFIAGAVVQWLRDGLGVIKSSVDVERLAASVPSSDGVIVVPALSASVLRTGILTPAGPSLA